MNLKQIVLVGLFIGSLVVANLLVATFGPGALPYTAFFMIGLDLTVRDSLHEQWHGRRLVRNMAIMIAAGAVIAFLMNRSSLWVGTASFAAFASAGLVDLAVYSLLFYRPWLVKVNVSNAAAALTDSLVFTLVAFHTFMPGLVATQWLIKLAGGALWSLILNRFRDKKQRNACTYPPDRRYEGPRAI